MNHQNSVTGPWYRFWMNGAPFFQKEFPQLVFLMIVVKGAAAESQLCRLFFLYFVTHLYVRSITTILLIRAFQFLSDFQEVSV